jgi:nucleoside-diphosphate-sugar epimerase
MKKILITGGAGFIGYHLGKYLADRGDKVTLVDNFFRSERDDDFLNLIARPNVFFIEADLTKYSEWQEKLGGQFDYVYHLAAVNGTGLFYDMPHEVLRINILTTLHALEWFCAHSKNGKILFTSSNEAYAGAREAFDALPYPTPEHVPLVIPNVSNPRWSYAGTKLIGEQLFIHYADKYGFRMSIVRPHNFYGPRAGYKHAIPELIMRIVDRADPFAVHGYDEKRSFCYIDDAIRAIVVTMESEKTDQGIYHIGSHEERKVSNLLETLFAAMEWRPNELDIRDPLPGSVKRRVPDISKIERDTGWKPETFFEEGLKKTIDWYLSHPRRHNS